LISSALAVIIHFQFAAPYDASTGPRGSAPSLNHRPALPVINVLSHHNSTHGIYLGVGLDWVFCI
jgi:hypothetical protein